MMGLRPAFLVPFSGLPEIVFPGMRELLSVVRNTCLHPIVGQLAAHSEISGVIEHYAIMASIIGSRGGLSTLQICHVY